MPHENMTIGINPPPSSQASPVRKMTVTLRAERHLAIDSPDHLMPWGTRINDCVNPRFNSKLWRAYPETQVVRILDLGCSGGAFVKSCIDDGHFAVGLEGSDFSKLHSRSAWATIPDFLFTCDVTRPWKLTVDRGFGDQPLNFDVVTAWDVIEHIQDSDLPSLAANVHSHLAPGGLWILSVANHEDIVGGVRLHQIVQPKAWWRKRFQELDFVPLDDFAAYFSTQFVRGARRDSERSFHFVLTNEPKGAPQVPSRSRLHRMHDRWLGSKAQRSLKRIVVGE